MRFSSHASWRCILRPICHLLRVLRYPCVLSRDRPGSVHQWRRHHLLEESLPTVWGWEELGFLGICTYHKYCYTNGFFFTTDLDSFIFTHWLLQLCRWSITTHCHPSPGIGYATQVIEAHLNVYYVVILAWAIFYLFNCFTTELPWAGCGHYWNTGRRRERLIREENFLGCRKINRCIVWHIHRELHWLLWRKCHQHYKPQRNISSDWVLGVSTF